MEFQNFSGGDTPAPPPDWESAKVPTPVSSQSIDKVTAILNMCISKLNTWFLANKLSLNLDKTCFSVFGVHDDNDRCKVQLRLGHVTLKHVNCCK